jgi:hypothetical protein
MLASRWYFLLPIVLFTLVCALATWLVLRMLGLPMLQAHWGILSYFLVITSILHGWQEASITTDPKGFVRRFMAGLSIKMFLSFFVLLAIMLAISNDSLLSVSLTFILLYLAFLGFSTARLTFVLRRKHS